MSKVVGSTDQDLSQVDWLAQLNRWAYAYGEPAVSGLVKQSPEHFIVTEMMDVEPSGEGEHYWLDITKTRLNTDAVAKSLARFSGVANRDVGYSGMKDFHAETRQWFSVWRPKGDALDWSKYELIGVQVNQVVKHSRKIKRGTHKTNHFQIRIVGLAAVDNSATLDVSAALDQRLAQIQKAGVPNYFGAQRFGRGANNLPQALAMFAGKKRVKDRNLRGILLSSARSWLFNSVVSARVNAATWQSLYVGEPANLNGSNSVFSVVDLVAETERLNLLDIHPSAPLWGEQNEINKIDGNTSMSAELLELETLAMADYSLLQQGLENARVEYQRRALRLVPIGLTWEHDNGDLCLTFELQRGQFATSILRELVR
ncbi:MAG: tRNA pseudouridine13 synthase [Arenicella sp.]|jgi:tRNA pseudouridine13 synthase